MYMHVFMKQNGNAYVEYLVIASIVLLATIGFYRSQLSSEQSGARSAVKTAFLRVCQSISGSSCN